MKKVFIEDYDKNSYPFNAVELCYAVTSFAKGYISSIDGGLDKNGRAIIVDFINYLGAKGGIDFALSSHDLSGCRDLDSEFYSNEILHVLFSNMSLYIYNYDMEKSVHRNEHLTKCESSFSAKYGKEFLIDFLNYISNLCGFVRKFSLYDLKCKNESLSFNADMNELKHFLECSNDYNRKLMFGMSIDDIYLNYCTSHNIDRFNVNDKCVEDDLMDQVYAMAYSYFKFVSDDKLPTKNPLINRALFEMGCSYDFNDDNIESLNDGSFEEPEEGMFINHPGNKESIKFSEKSLRKIAKVLFD